MLSPRLNVSARLRDLMAYDKLTGDVPKVLVLESDYWLDRACLSAARDLGWEVACAPVRMEGRMPRDMVATLLETLTTFRPDFILTVNLSGMDEGGLFAGLFSDLAVPYVTWFVDDPRTILMGRSQYASDYAVALTWESAYIPYLRACGFPEVQPLPLAVDPALFNAPPADEHPLPPAFVGNSMTDFAAREWAWIEDKPALAQALREAFAQGHVTRERFAEGLDAMIDPGFAATLDSDAQRHAEMFCFIEGTRRLRARVVQAAAPEGLEVFGDEGWQSVVPVSKDYIDYRAQLPTFYRACPVNLNITSIQMASTVNQRVFDCPAAGGFLLSDDQADLDNLFDRDSEVVTYQSPEEARDLLCYFNAHPEARRPVIERAQARIRAQHTYHHRLHRIVDILRHRFA